MQIIVKVHLESCLRRKGMKKAIQYAQDVFGMSLVQAQDNVQQLANKMQKEDIKWPE